MRQLWRDGIWPAAVFASPADRLSCRFDVSGGSPMIPSVRARWRVSRLARAFCWSIGVVGGAAVMWLGAALFSGLAASAATPTLTLAASPSRYRTDSTTTGQAPHPQTVPSLLLPSLLPVTSVRGSGTGEPGRGEPVVVLAASVTPLPADDVWDRVARCESGGRWNINTGNGYHGGLQFTSSTWKAYGGTKYASSAHLASREQQIEVARKVLAGQGPGAWPVCSRNAGLTRAHAGAPEGATGRPAVRPTSAPTRPLPTAVSKPATKPKDNDKDRDKDRDKRAAHHPAARPAAPRAQVPTPPLAAKQLAPSKIRAKKHTKYKAGKHAAHGKLTVTGGDTLSALATAHHVKGGWRALYEANKDRVRDPNLIVVGQRLVLPSTGE
jgi:resuscitation-promoting factor RpfA